MLLLLKIYVLSLLVDLAPSKPISQLQPWADNIAQETFNHNQQLQVCSMHNIVPLAVVGFCETGFRGPEIRHVITYGLSCCTSSFKTLNQATILASKILTTARRRCGPNLQKILGYYHSGACRRDGYSDMEARIAYNLTRRRHNALH